MLKFVYKYKHLIFLFIPVDKKKPRLSGVPDIFYFAGLGEIYLSNFRADLRKISVDLLKVFFTQLVPVRFKFLPHRSRIFSREFFRHDIDAKRIQYSCEG